MTTNPEPIDPSPVAAPVNAAVATSNPTIAAPPQQPVWLEPADVRLTRSPHGRVRLTLEDRVCYSRVKVRRLTPLSEPASYISLWAGDQEEIGILVDLDGLDAQSRAILVEELARRYFMPVIRRVLAIRSRYGIQHWTVETDAGPRQFDVRGLHQNVRRLDAGRLIITDVMGNRYDIPDAEALDYASVMRIQNHT